MNFKSANQHHWLDLLIIHDNVLIETLIAYTLSECGLKLCRAVIFGVSDRKLIGQYRKH